MRRFMLGIGASVAVVGAVAAIAQESGSAPSRDEIAAMFATVGAPAPEHARLGVLEGSWDVVTSFHFSEEPLVIHSIGRGEWRLDGRFMEFSWESAADEQIPMKGLTIHGYDTRTGEYTIVGFDTLGTYYVTASGSYDEATNALRLIGEVTEGAMTMRYGWDVEMHNDDHVTMFVRHADADAPGGWRTIVESKLTRIER